MDKDLNAARRALSPHVLVLHFLFCRLQAARYYQPNVMFLIRQLVVRSARNYKRVRYKYVHSPLVTVADSSLSTHALAREPRFSFLLFGFEALKSSHLDAYCENLVRDSLYKMALSWYSVRPQYVLHLHCAQGTPHVKTDGRTVQIGPNLKPISRSSLNFYPSCSRTLFVGSIQYQHCPRYSLHHAQPVRGATSDSQS
jgi:hypothetical protein